MLLEARVPLVEVHADHGERERGALLDAGQQPHEGVAVFAAGQAHQDAIVGLDEAEITAGATHLRQQALLEGDTSAHADLQRGRP